MPEVLYERKGRLAVVTLNRPEALNALNGPVRRGLLDAFTAFRDDPDAWVAIVTGSGTSPGRVASIGEAISRLLARRGARVAVVDIDEAAAGRTVETIRSEVGEAIALAADLRREDECARAAAAVAAGVGGLEDGVEPAVAAGLAAADGADGHGANLTLAISVKRPLGRTAISLGAAIWRDQARASVTVCGTGMPGARCRHQATAFCRA